MTLNEVLGAIRGNDVREVVVEAGDAGNVDDIVLYGDSVRYTQVKHAVDARTPVGAAWLLKPGRTGRSLIQRFHESWLRLGGCHSRPYLQLITDREVDACDPVLRSLDRKSGLVVPTIKDASLNDHLMDWAAHLDISSTELTSFLSDLRFVTGRSFALELERASLQLEILGLPSDQGAIDSGLALVREWAQSRARRLTVPELTTQLERRIGTPSRPGYAVHAGPLGTDKGAASSARQGAEAAVLLRSYLESVVANAEVDTWVMSLGRDARHLVQPRVLMSSGGRVEPDPFSTLDGCTTAVIVGEPGDGKTWLARSYAAWKARRSLRDLDSGVDVEQIDIPLILRLADLAPRSGPVRSAMVRSALAALPNTSEDTFVQLESVLARRGRVTAILDALDEAPQIQGDWLRLATTVEGWRTIVTTRPRSWRGQVAIRSTHPDEEVFTLEPLSYPDGVARLVRAWFEGDAGSARVLIQALAIRDEIRHLVRTPILCVLVCLALEENGTLPRSRRDLMRVAVRRLLSGEWRGEFDTIDDWQPLERQLRTWALESAKKDPISRVGQWQTVIEPSPADRSLGVAERQALSNVAPQSGPPDPLRGAQPRRFIHRMVLEHLVAEAISELPVDDAASMLHEHLWFDDDWKESAPLAVAYHPLAEDLLRKVFRLCVANLDEKGVTQLETNTEVRMFLCRVAAETTEERWQSFTELVHLVRVQIASDCSLEYELKPAVTALRHWSDPDHKIASLLRERLFSIGFLREHQLRTLVDCILSLRPESKDEIARWLTKALQFHTVRALGYLALLPKCVPLEPAIRGEVASWSYARLLESDDLRAADILKLLDELFEDQDWRSSVRAELTRQFLTGDADRAHLPMVAIRALFESAPTEWKSTVIDVLGVETVSTWISAAEPHSDVVGDDERSRLREQVMSHPLSEADISRLAPAIARALEFGPSEPEMQALKTRAITEFEKGPSEFSLDLMTVLRRMPLSNEERAALRDASIGRLLNPDPYSTANELYVYLELGDPDDPVAQDIAHVRWSEDRYAYAPGTLTSMDRHSASAAWAAKSQQALDRLLHGDARLRPLTFEELLVFVGDRGWRAAARRRLLELLRSHEGPRAGRVLSCLEPTEDERREAFATLESVVPTWPDYELERGLMLVQQFRNPGDDLVPFAPLFDQLTHYEADIVLSSMRRGSTWHAWISLVPHIPPIHLDSNART